MEHNKRFEGDYELAEDRETAAHIIAAGNALAIDNDMVFALWGDGASPHFRENVAAVKGSEATKPFGLTLSNEQFLEYVDFDRLSPEVAHLFEDPAHLTNLSGALIFWRVPGRLHARDNLPDTVWSTSPEGRPVIQNWSPEGKSNITHLLVHARQLGVNFFAVTSLNTTKEPEITMVEKARAFARDKRLDLLTDIRAKHLISGSYPVVSADREGLCIVRGRPAAIGSLILSRLLDGYPLTISDPSDVQPGWDIPELQNLKGMELREALLLQLGWAKTL